MYTQLYTQPRFRLRRSFGGPLVHPLPFDDGEEYDAVMFALILLTGFIGLHWKLLLFIGCCVAAARWGRQEWARWQAWLTAEAEWKAAVATRADTQHREVMCGDDHGVYGEGWPAMRNYRNVA